MKNAGFLSLPPWKEKLREILVRIGRKEVLKLPLLGRENSDNVWQAFDPDEFFSLVQTGIAFTGKNTNDFTESLITSDPSLAISRIKKGFYNNTFFSAAIGGTFPFISILSDYCLSKPFKFFVQNDAFAGFVLSSMEKDGKSFDEALYEARWKESPEEINVNFSLHGITSRDRLVLQIAEMFGCFIDPDNISYKGINNLEKSDVSIAKELKMSIRLLGVAEYDGLELKAFSEPCLIPEKYFLAQARGGSEIIYAMTKDSLSHVYACPGSSKESVVCGILKDLSLASSPKKRDLIELDKISQFSTKFYMRFNLINPTRTLAELLNLFAQHGIEIERIYHPKACSEKDGMPLVVFVNSMTQSVLTEALRKIAENISLASLKSCFRFIDRG